MPVLASFDDPRLPPRALDLVLIVDTYHHLDDRLTYLRRLAQALKPAGRIAVVDWQKRDLPVGPPAEHKLARDRRSSTEMRAAGYTLAAEPRILPHQYVLIFAALTSTRSKTPLPAAVGLGSLAAVGIVEVDGRSRRRVAMTTSCRAAASSPPADAGAGRRLRPAWR